MIRKDCIHYGLCKYSCADTCKHYSVTHVRKELDCTQCGAMIEDKDVAHEVLVNGLIVLDIKCPMCGTQYYRAFELDELTITK